MAEPSEPERHLTERERERLAALASATSLAEVQELTRLPNEHDAYVEAKREWMHLRGRDPDAVPVSDGLPGRVVTVDDCAFWVHGITHADTDAERAYVRGQVASFVDEGASVYCEQGIRPMYFADFDEVCEMDDYRWAMQACTTDAVGAQIPDIDDAFGPGNDDVEEFRSRLREAAFSLLSSHGDAFGERVQQSLGALASTFLTSYGALATADDYTSHQLSRRAARDPSKLGRLQHYYETAFLPQPVEREWLRRHDPDLERATHARNERMADYAIYHAEDVDEVHLIVGAAHQPGVCYYLQEHAAGKRSVAGFELC